MTVVCRDCDQRFANELELDQHRAMVHEEEWHGESTFSQSGDEQAVGAIDKWTTDEIDPRPDARERAESRQS